MQEDLVDPVALREVHVHDSELALAIGSGIEHGELQGDGLGQLRLAFALQLDCDSLVCIDGAKIEVDSFSSDERSVVSLDPKSLAASHSEGNVICVVSGQNSEQVVHKSFRVVPLVESFDEVDVSPCIMAQWGYEWKVDLLVCACEEVYCDSGLDQVLGYFPVMVEA